MTSFCQRPSIPRIRFRLFYFSLSTFLVQSNRKWRLYLLSTIIGTTLQLLITPIFFAFSQRRIMDGFLHFLYSELSGTRTKYLSFWETAHRLTRCPRWSTGVSLLREKNLSFYVYFQVIFCWFGIVKKNKSHIRCFILNLEKKSLWINNR